MFLFRRPPPPAELRGYYEAPAPQRDRPWREQRFAVVDVETSGLNSRRDALLSVGLVEIEAGRVRLDRRWQSLIRPPEGLLVAGDSIRIHGLLREDLAAAPPAAEVLRELLARLAGRVLVVHVAAIDVAFINRALRASFGQRLRGPALDTARLAVTLHQQAQVLSGNYASMPLPAIALRGLAAQHNLPIYPQHNALNDALTTAQLFLAQATRLEGRGQGSLRALLRAGGA